MIILTVGLPKHGKTQWLMDYVWRHARRTRFFVVDRAGEWDAEHVDPDTGTRRWRGAFTEWTGRLARLARVVGPAQRAPDSGPWFARAPEGLDAALAWARELPSTGVYTFAAPWEGVEVAQLCRELGDVVLVDDEIDLTATSAGWAVNENPLRDFVHRGRHLPNADGKVCRVDVLGACRRFQSLHIDVPSMADLVVLFRVQGARTVKRLLEESIIEDADVPALLALPRFDYFEKVPGEPLVRRTLPTL